MAAYRYVRLPDHPLASTNGLIAEHRLVLYERIGPGEHPCHWCDSKVEWRRDGRTHPGSLVSDHLDGDTRNNAPENLVPSCHPCNCGRSRPDAVGDDEVFIVSPSRRGRHRAVLRTCESCGERFPHLAAEKRPNRGRFCSSSCRARGPSE